MSERNTAPASSSSAISIRKRIRCDSDPQDLDLTFNNPAGTSSSRRHRDLNRHRPPEKMSRRYQDPEADGVESDHDQDFDADTDGDAEMDPIAVNDLIYPSSSSNESVALSMRQFEKKPAQTTVNTTYADVVKEFNKTIYKRDDAYYFEDGSCVLLVGDTLFNVCWADLHFIPF